MTLNIPLDKYYGDLSKKYESITLKLPKRKLKFNETGLLFELLVKGHIHSIESDLLSLHIDLFNELPDYITLVINIDTDNLSDFIQNYHYLKSLNIKFRVIGEWNKETISNVKKISHLGFSQIIAFKTFKTINQGCYEDLIKFIFFNSLLNNSDIEPFKSIFLNLIGENNSDLYSIYSENIGSNFYVDNNENVSNGYLGIKSKRIFGKLKDGLFIWQKSDSYEKMMNLYNNNFLNKSKCIECNFFNLCRGYVINNYHDECELWKEILLTIKDISNIRHMDV